MLSLTKIVAGNLLSEDKPFVSDGDLKIFVEVQQYMGENQATDVDLVCSADLSYRRYIQPLDTQVGLVMNLLMGSLEMKS